VFRFHGVPPFAWRDVAVRLGLARSPSRLWPDFGVTRRVQYGEYNHLRGFNTVEDSIWKARNESSAHFTVNLPKHFRIALDGFKR